MGVKASWLWCCTRERERSNGSVPGPSSALRESVALDEPRSSREFVPRRRCVRETFPVGPPCFLSRTKRRSQRWSSFLRRRGVAPDDLYFVRRTGSSPAMAPRAEGSCRHAFQPPSGRQFAGLIDVLIQRAPPFQGRRYFSRGSGATLRHAGDGEGRARTPRGRRNDFAGRGEPPEGSSQGRADPGLTRCGFGRWEHVRRRRF